MRAPVVWITGVPAAGKSTLAEWLCERLRATGGSALHLDGDELRAGINSDLGFSEADRGEAARRTAAVAILLAGQGTTAVISMVSPVRSHRQRARDAVEASGLRWIEVHVDTARETCVARDPKGLYARAAAGELTGLTGWDGPYDPPHAGEALRVDGADPEPGRAVLEALDALSASSV